MSNNPFKIISSTEDPPEHLRQEVLGSVRLAVLMMRFAQLFLADYAAVLFEKFKIMPDDASSAGDPPTPKI